MQNPVSSLQQFGGASADVQTIDIMREFMGVLRCDIVKLVHNFWELCVLQGCFLSGHRCIMVLFSLLLSYPIVSSGKKNVFKWKLFIFVKPWL